MVFTIRPSDSLQVVGLDQGDSGRFGRALHDRAVAAKQMALQALANLRLEQSSALAYFDSFIVFAAISALLALPVFLMKRSVATKGAHVAAEKRKPRRLRCSDISL